jgi:hypothetical protein
MVAQSLALGHIRGCDEVGINRAKSWRSVLAILQPKPLICGISTHVIGVHNDHEPTILKGSRVQQDGVLKINANKTPFTCG